MKAKIIHLKQPEILKNDPFPNKVSLEELRKIWNDKNYIYTDDELMRIREWLYAIASTTLRIVNEKFPISLNTIQHDNLENDSIAIPELKKAS